MNTCEVLDHLFTHTAKLEFLLGEKNICRNTELEKFENQYGK